MGKHQTPRPRSLLGVLRSCIQISSKRHAQVDTSVLFTCHTSHRRQNRPAWYVVLVLLVHVYQEYIYKLIPLEFCFFTFLLACPGCNRARLASHVLEESSEPYMCMCVHVMSQASYSSIGLVFAHELFWLCDFIRNPSGAKVPHQLSKIVTHPTDSYNCSSK